jgi:hypothetical protein
MQAAAQCVVCRVCGRRACVAFAASHETASCSTRTYILPCVSPSTPPAPPLQSINQFGNWFNWVALYEVAVRLSDGRVRAGVRGAHIWELDGG